MPPSRRPRLVVAAVIRDNAGRVLMARRPAGSHLGGLWEFPGGGVEEGEAPVEALVRELDEELGVAARIGEPLTFAWHRDEQRDVVLLFYSAEIEAGTPRGVLGQEVGWFSPAELAGLDVPPADRRLVDQLSRARSTRPVESRGTRGQGTGDGGQRNKSD
jgi:8-oxo-dGTP diphosphatase